MAGGTTSEAGQDIWAALRRVGLSQAGGTFDALADPIATDALATALADRLRDARLDLVVVWEGLNSTTLGYAVALRLGVPVSVLTDDEGLVTTATPARGGRRAALVASLTPDAAIARMVAGFLSSQGTALVATATLVRRAGETDGIALAELAPDEAPTSLSRGPSPSPLPRLPRSDGR